MKDKEKEKGKNEKQPASELENHCSACSGPICSEYGFCGGPALFDYKNASPADDSVF